MSLLGILIGTAAHKANDAVNSLTTPLEKDSMQIEALVAQLHKEGDEVTNLDAEVAEQNDRLKTLQAAKDQAVQDMRDTPLASPGDQAALDRACAKVATAEAAANAQVDLLKGLQGQATIAHANWTQSKETLAKRQAEVTQDQATVILTHATTISTSIAQQNKAFDAAASAGNDAHAQISRELHKAQAEAALDAPDADKLALDALHAKQRAAEVLARYGMAPAAPATPAAAS